MKQSHLLAIALAVQSGLALLCAQSTVTLAPVASPSAAQPGVTTVSLTGSGFPSGTILPQDVLITLAVAGQPGVKSSMAPAVFAASAVQPLFGTSERVTFTIPAGTFIVASPTSCQVSIAGSTTGSVQFTSGNTASLTVNPAATISLSPASGDPGQSEPVTITGLYTNFLQGSTVASFGPSISVGMVRRYRTVRAGDSYEREHRYGAIDDQLVSAFRGAMGASCDRYSGGDQQQLHDHCGVGNHHQFAIAGGYGGCDLLTDSRGNWGQRSLYVVGDRRRVARPVSR